MKKTDKSVFKVQNGTMFDKEEKNHNILGCGHVSWNVESFGLQWSSGKSFKGEDTLSDL